MSSSRRRLTCGRWLVWATAVAILSTLSGFGVELRAEEDDGFLGTVGVQGAAALPEPAGTAPLATTTCDPDETTSPDGSVAGMLEGVQSLEVMDSGGPGQRATIMLRGTDAQQTLLLYGGLPLNVAHGPGIDLSLLPKELVGQVGVYRGGLSPLFGSAALGGVVAIVPPFAFDTGLTGTLSLTTGPWSTYRVGTSATGGTKSGLGFVLAASHLATQGDFEFVDTNGTPRIRDNNDVASSSAGLRLVIPFGKGVKLGVSSLVATSEAGAPGFEQFPSLGARLAQTFVLQSLDLVVPSLPVLPSVSLEGSLGYRWSEAHYTDPADFLGRAIDSDNGDHLVQAKLAFTWTASQILVTVAPFVSYEAASISSLQAGESAPTRWYGGLSALAELDLLDEHLTLQPVVRLDASDGFGATVVPGLWLAARLLGPLGIKGGISRSYRLPSFDELYFDLGYLQGNPALHPEDAWTVEGHLTATFSAASLSVGGFWRSIDNLILFLPKTAFYTEADDSKAATTWGVEASASATPLPWLGVSGFYTFMDSRFDDTGLSLPFRPSHRLGGLVSVQMSGLQLFVRADWRSGVYLNRFETTEEEGRLFVDLGAKVSPVPQVTASLTIKNLLDVRGAVDYLQMPLPGIGAYLTLGLTL